MSKRQRREGIPVTVFGADGVALAGTYHPRFPKWATQDYFARRYAYLHDRGVEKIGGKYYWARLATPMPISEKLQED